MLGKMDIHLKRSDLVLDGRNVIDNNSDKVIISERICLENKGKSSQVLKNELENLLSAKVALVPDPGCTTGHADGIVAFIEDDVLLIGDYGDAVYCGAVEVAVKNVFPEVKTFRLPCGIPGRQSGLSGNRQIQAH